MRRLRLLPVALVAGLVLPSAAFAATITVNTTADEVAAGGTCSLREAVTVANADSAGTTGCTRTGGGDPDTILLPATATHYALTIPPAGPDDNATGDLNVTSYVIVKGNSPTTAVVDGTQKDRVIHLTDGNILELQDLTVTGGLTGSGAAGADATAAGPGGASEGGSGGNGTDGGGILSQGTLILTNVLVTGNATGRGGEGGAGNHGGNGGAGSPGGGSSGGNGGAGGNGGGIAQTAGQLSLTDSRVTGNATGAGGAGGNAGTAGDGGSDGTTGRAGGTTNQIRGYGRGGGLGGGVYGIGANVNVVIDHSTIANNRTGAGGAGGTGGTGGAGGGGSGANGAGGDTTGGGGGFGGAGGGMAIGALTMSDSTVSGNVTGPGGAGGAGGHGGNAGTGSGPQAAGGTAQGGSAGGGGVGGGVWGAAATTITSTTVSGNRTGAGGQGGAGGTGGNGAPAAASVPDSRGGFAYPGGDGGGLYLLGVNGFENVTIVGNGTGAGGSGGGGGTGPDTSEGGGGYYGGYGGGLELQTGASSTMTNATVATNVIGGGGSGGAAGGGATKTAGPAGGLARGGAIEALGSPLKLHNSLFAANSVPFCEGNFDSGSSGNLSFPDTSCGAFHLDPKLGPLKDNGGPTQTMTLGAGSGAIDRVASLCPGSDQRGVARPKGGACDIGAVERSLPAATTGPAGAITKSAAHVTGSANPGGIPAAYRYEYGTSIAYGRSTAGVSAGSGIAAVQAPSAITHLLPDTRYHYRLVVTNPDGVARGADRTFKTAHAPPFAGVTIRTTKATLNPQGRAPIAVSCPADAIFLCRGKLTLTAKVNKKKRNIGSARFSIAAGRTAVLDVKINKAARGRERSVRARASAQDARRRTPVVTTSKVMLKPAPAAAR